MDNLEFEQIKEAVRKKRIGPDQKAHLEAEIRLVGFEAYKLCKLFEVESLECMTINDYLYALEKLKKMRKKRRCKSRAKSKVLQPMQSHAKSE